MIGAALVDEVHGAAFGVRMILFGIACRLQGAVVVPAGVKVDPGRGLVQGPVLGRQKR